MRNFCKTIYKRYAPSIGADFIHGGEPHWVGWHGRFYAVDPNRNRLSVSFRYGKNVYMDEKEKQLNQYLIRYHSARIIHNE